VPNGLIDQPVLRAPGGGATVQLQDPRALGSLQSCSQQIAEQLVKPPPVAFVVQGDEEQVGALQSFQHVLAIGITGDHVAEWAAEAVQDRGLQQERLDPPWLSLQYLLAQVVQDVAMGSRQLSQERVRIRTLTQGQCG
jgi:hypothetical protein